MRTSILIATLCALATPVMAQGIGESISVGEWMVRRVEDSSGGIQTCVAAQVADDMSGVGFGATNRDKTFVMLIDQKGKWTPGQEYSLSYTIDSRKTTKTMATATNPTTLIQVIGTVADGGPVFDVVQAGNAIQLDTAASVYDYPLAGSRTALNALATCLGLAMGR